MRFLELAAFVFAFAIVLQIISAPQLCMLTSKNHCGEMPIDYNYYEVNQTLSQYATSKNYTAGPNSMQGTGGVGFDLFGIGMLWQGFTMFIDALNKATIGFPLLMTQIGFTGDLYFFVWPITGIVWIIYIIAIIQILGRFSASSND